jgi:hypothetical protein
MLMLGREIELPVDLIYGPHPQSEEFPEQYLHTLITCKNACGKFKKKPEVIY